MCFVFDIHVYFEVFLMYFMHINVSGRLVLLSNKLIDIICKWLYRSSYMNMLLLVSRAALYCRHN